MQMHDRRAERVRFEGRIGDLARRDRNRWMLADRVPGAGDGAGDDDIGVQVSPLPASTTLRHGDWPRKASRPGSAMFNCDPPI
jgi:hypothetical protein